jgi:hypothetical protein
MLFLSFRLPQANCLAISKVVKQCKAVKQFESYDRIFEQGGQTVQARMIVFFTRFSRLALPDRVTVRVQILPFATPYP